MMPTGSDRGFAAPTRRGRRSCGTLAWPKWPSFRRVRPRKNLSIWLDRYARPSAIWPEWLAPCNPLAQCERHRTKRHCPSRVTVVRRRLALRGPRQQRLERGTQRLSPIRHAVFDLWGNLVMDDPPNNTVLLHLTELLNQHLLRD